MYISAMKCMPVQCGNLRSSVAVIGAGVSGLIAARELARRGIDVKVYDQKPKPGYPVRASGIFSISGLEGLGIGYKPAITNTLYGAMIYVGTKKMKVLSNEPQAYVLDRLRLNEICMEEAEKHGASIELGKRLDGETLDKIHNDSIIIGADGVPSLVASHFHFPPIHRHILTYRAEYGYSLEDTRLAELYFDKKTTPGFFAWISPESSNVTEIAVGVDSRYGNSKSAFDKFLQKRRARGIALHSKQISGSASIIPISLRKRLVNEREEVLLIGDAAGQTKPSTGGGIIFGGNAAITAAKAVAAHIRNGLPLTSYEKKWKSEFSKEIRLHEASRRIYSSKGFGIMLLIMKYLGIDSLLGTYGNMDKPTKIVKDIILRRKQHG